MQYRIYYADGTTYSGAPEDTPGFGVIVILQKEHDGRYVITSNAPYYMMTTDNTWLPCYENDIIDSLVHRLGEIKGFCVGQIVSKKRFKEIFDQAKKDRAAENLD